jgi:hypothetical protein
LNNLSSENFLNLVKVALPQSNTFVFEVCNFGYFLEVFFFSSVSLNNWYS